jgi:hypothetical protein
MNAAPGKFGTQWLRDYYACLSCDHRNYSVENSGFTKAITLQPKADV